MSVFLDLETTGLDVNTAQIIQCAAIAVDQKGEVIDTFERKVQFDVLAADPVALAINHYDAEVWTREAAAPLTFALDFSRWLNKHCTEDKVSKGGIPYKVAKLKGYNASVFDVPLLRSYFYREAPGVFLPVDHRVRDVLQQVYWYFELNEHLIRPADQAGRESFKLGDVCRYFGVDLTGAHDAMSDVLATVKLSQLLLNSKATGGTFVQ